MTAKTVLRFTKVERYDEELGILWGYASVADVVDLQGHEIPQTELVQAMYRFMADYYLRSATILENHDQPPEVVLVESTFHFLAGKLRWYVGVMLLTDELRQAARDGEFSGFSIGGNAEIPEGEAAEE